MEQGSGPDTRIWQRSPQSAVAAFLAAFITFFGPLAVNPASAQVDPFGPVTPPGQTTGDEVPTDEFGNELGPRPTFPTDPKYYIAIDALDPKLHPEEPWIIDESGVPQPQARPPIPPKPVIREPLDQAFSIREGDTAIELTFGEQPALGETLGMRVGHLILDPGIIELAPSQTFELDTLLVSAFSTTGELIEHAPLRIEIEAPQGMVDLEGFEADGRTLRMLTPGVARIWVTSVLPALITENFSAPIPIIVRDPTRPPVPLSSRIYEGADGTR